MKRLMTKVSRFFTHSFMWLGIGSILWLLMRSGTKPSRLRYPCQRAAAGAGSLWLSAFAFPGILRGLRAVGLSLPEVRPSRPARNLLMTAGVLAVALFAVYRLGLGTRSQLRTIGSCPHVPPPVQAGLPAWTSARPVQSHIFVVDSVPVPDSMGTYHEGLDTLLSLLAQNGTCLYKSSKHLPWCDTAGIIGKNDVVLLKVNAEWDQRGMPSTDLLKGLIARIVAHPDTFAGEIELVENGQWRQSWAYSANNAERHSQTMQEVVDTFAARGYHVGDYNWTAIGYSGNNHWVNEYNQGDTVSGYVREESTGMTYAKFTTSYGTHVSTRLGVWNDSSYEPARLKFINLPVLKCHQYMGVSASVKHYIGFLSYADSGNTSMHRRAMTQGLLGVDFGKARFPDLNIIDATWVSAEITTGPNAPYNMCTRLNTLVASKDPIAADYYAGRYVLRPASWWNGHSSLHNYGRMDPDNLNTENPGNGHSYSDSTPCYGFPYNAFHQMLVSSRDQMLRYGHQVTMDTTQMTIHHFRFPGAAVSESPRTMPVVDGLMATPNPVNGRPSVSYELGTPASVRLMVFSADGRKVAELAQGMLPAGRHRLILDRALAPGTYLLTLEAGSARESTKLVVPGR
ncbi:MAG TPA: DUF362 domain-containing protein [bacterium]|nr:DUF362 domain-containing protein [bacterium]